MGGHKSEWDNHYRGDTDWGLQVRGGCDIHWGTNLGGVTSLGVTHQWGRGDESELTTSSDGRGDNRSPELLRAAMLLRIFFKGSEEKTFT